MSQYNDKIRVNIYSALNLNFMKMVESVKKINFIATKNDRGK